MKNIEIEIQVNVQNTRILSSFLEKNASFKYRHQQIDEYFTPAHRNFLASRPINEWLRLRNSDDTFFINYKNWHRDKKGKSYYCDEFESKIENINQVRKIFKMLNIKPLIKVDKKRQVWQYQNFEIALDSVKNLGEFVEIEYKNPVTNKKVNPKKITDQMIAFLKSQKCGKIKRNYQGYPFLLLFPNEAKYETI